MPLSKDFTTPCQSVRGLFLGNFGHYRINLFRLHLHSKINTMLFNRILLSASLLFLGFFFQSCEGEAQDKSEQIVTINEVDANQAETLLAQNDDIQLVDVRTQGEVDQGYIDGAVHVDFMQWDEFTAGVEKLDKSQPVMVYCKVGGRSHKAAQYLVENGFEEVYDIRGGIDAWNKEGKPLKKD